MDENKLHQEIDILKENIDLSKINKIAKISKVISLIVIPLMLVLFIYGTFKLNDLNKKFFATNLKLENAEIKLNDYRMLKDSLESQMDMILATSLNAFGWPLEEVKLEYKFGKNIVEALNANSEIRKIVFKDNYQEPSGIEIQYYPKHKDKYKVVVALEEFGFDISTKKSNDKLLNQKTNTIWYGKSVPIKNVKLVAYTLMRAGVEVKFIIEVDNLSKNKILIGTLYPDEQKERILVSEIKESLKFMNCPTLKPCRE